MRKKILMFLLTISVVMSLLCCSASAHDFVSEPATEILLADLWDTATIEVDNDAVILTETKTYENTKKQEVRNTQQGLQQASTESYAKEIVFLLPKEGYTPEDIYNELSEKFSPTSSRASGDKTETDRDSSISVEGTLTIYYDRQTVNGTTYVKLTQVDGGYRILDNQVRVKEQDLTVGCSGWVLGKGPRSQSDLLICGTYTSWSYTTPSDWDFVCDDGTVDYLVGANCTYTLQRVGSTHTWDLYLVNDL